VEERLTEINNSMTTLMDRVDDMDKRLEELESIRDFEELCREVQVAVNSVIANVNNEIQALKASETAKNAKIQAYDETRIEALEAQLKVCMAPVANMGNGGLVQVSTTRNGNALRPPTCNGARNARKIDNFFGGLEAYFGAVSIEDEAQKVSNASFFLLLKDIALV